MKKTYLVIIIAISLASEMHAQSDTVSAKKNIQYAGVQINLLIRQVLNFSNSAVNNNNPYLLTYSFNNQKTGRGMRFGLGYEYNSTEQNDGITEQQTHINDVQLRVGYDKMFRLGARWQAGLGVDLVLNSNNDKTSTKQGTPTNYSMDEVTTTETSFGGGPMAWLRFRISRHILIGTESSFYFTTGKPKQTIQISSMNGNMYTQNTTNFSSTNSEAIINLPSAIFFLVSF